MKEQRIRVTCSQTFVLEDAKRLDLNGVAVNTLGHAHFNQYAAPAETRVKVERIENGVPTETVGLCWTDEDARV